MSAARTSIGGLLGANTVGTEVPADRQTVPEASVPGWHSAEPVSLFVLPKSQDARQRLTHCQNAISHAQTRSRAGFAAIERQWILWVGPPLRIVRDENLWQLDGYASYDDWCKQAYGFSANYANRHIRAAPVVHALLPIVEGRQIRENITRPLAAILTSHGPEAVRRVWTTAKDDGNLTERGIREVAQRLGYIHALPNDTDAPAPAKAVAVRLAPGAKFDGAGLDAIAESDPDYARSVAYYLLARVGDGSSRSAENNVS